MKGLDLARNYYLKYGRVMIQEQFGTYAPHITVGLCGEGSECFGFDDEISKDHDFGPAFCMWLDREVMDEIGERLIAEYEALPAFFEGMPARRDNRLTGHRIGVWETGEFYRHFLGDPNGPQTLMAWLNLPDSYLAVATNGAVFEAGEGRFLEIRNRLKQGHPEDVRIKKMAARAANMSQAGQYNLPRCVKRGEYVAAGLALAEFVRHGMVLIYLLNHRYAPFYKWMHRGLGELEILGETKNMFAELMDPQFGRMTGQGQMENLEETGGVVYRKSQSVPGKRVIQEFWEQKQETVETICRLISEEWQRQGLIRHTDTFLQNSLDELMRQIRDPQIAGLPWLYG